MAIDYRKKFKEKLEKNKAIQNKIRDKHDELIKATNYWEAYEKPRNTQAEIEAYEVVYEKFRAAVDKKDKALFRSFHENPQGFYDQGYKALEEKYLKKSAAQSRIRDFQESQAPKVRAERSKINRGSNKFDTPIEERLNNYKNNKPVKVGLKQTNPAFFDNNNTLNKNAKKSFKNDYLGRKQKVTTKADKVALKVEPTAHTLDLNYSVDGAGTRVNNRGKLGGGRKAGNNIKSRTKAGVGTGVETKNRLLPTVEVSKPGLKTVFGNTEKLTKADVAKVNAAVEKGASNAVFDVAKKTELIPNFGSAERVTRAEMEASNKTNNSGSHNVDDFKKKTTSGSVRNTNFKTITKAEAAAANAAVEKGASNAVFNSASEELAFVGNKIHAPGKEVKAGFQNLEKIERATKTKSVSRQFNELQKNILSGSFSQDDINKAYDSLNLAKKDRKIKVDKYLEARAKRPHNAKKPVTNSAQVITKKPVLINKSIEKPAAATPKAGKTKHIYTVFDFETNGKIKGNGVDKVMPEVLSYSAQKYELDLLTGKSVFKESMQGYYQPKDGNFNAGAQRVHGLDQAKIEAARTDKNYGATFEDDKAKLIEFMNKDSDAIVAHNLNEFDGNYFVGELDKEITKVDTYKVAKDAHLETNVLQYSEANNGDIHTKSNSSVYHYYENKMPEGDLHDAVNDVKITAENYHNMVLDEKTSLAHNLGLDKTNVKEFNRAKSDHYYRITVGKNGEKITTKMSAKTNQPLTVDGEVAEALKRKEKAMAGVDIAENAKAATRKFGDTMREFGTAAKKFSDDFSKLSTGKKAGRIAGAAAIIGGGALLVKTAKDRRKAEQEKLKSITASVEKNRSGGF